MEAPREALKKVQGGIRRNSRAVSEARGVRLQGPRGLWTAAGSSRESRKVSLRLENQRLLVTWSEAGS